MCITMGWIQLNQLWHCHSDFSWVILTCRKLTHYPKLIPYDLMVNNGSDNCLLPDGTKPLSEPKLTLYYLHPSQCSFTDVMQNMPAKLIKNLIFKIRIHLPGDKALMLLFYWHPNTIVPILFSHTSCLWGLHKRQFESNYRYLFEFHLSQQHKTMFVVILDQ